jgi:predicted nucleotide-binding protein (sugar kinase/HSP70/actin superfamily)
MKVTFPHLGYAYVAIEALLEGLGHEPVTPPLGTKSTLECGIRHSPEEACLPFKTILGNMLEGIECGADSVFMIGGWGPCRLGYYGEIQRIILLDAGKEVEFVTLEVPEGSLSRRFVLARKILGPTCATQFVRGCRLSWAKMKVIDELENLSLRVRPLEKRHGATSRLLAQQVQRLREAQSMRNIRTIQEQASQGLRDLAGSGPGTGRPGSEPLRIGIVGEIYTVVEPSVNLRLEERLGYLGVEVVRTISLPRWIEDHIFKNALGLYTRRTLKRSAAGYLSGFIGGHGLESIARSVDLATGDVDGIIHIFPLSCMPEVIAQGILPQISQDKKVPIMSLVVDEHTGETGFQTRLEAFVDLLQRRVAYAVRPRGIPRD